jgi:hypothetical protein
LKKIFLGKRVPFYISLGCALMILVSSILYASYFFAAEREYMKDFVSWLVPFVPLMGIVGFIGLTLLKQSRIGTAVMSASAFAGFVIYANTIFGFVVENIMNSMVELPVIIVSASLLLVGFITSNVTAWAQHE